MFFGRPGTWCVIFFGALKDLKSTSGCIFLGCFRREWMVLWLSTAIGSIQEHLWFRIRKKIRIRVGLELVSILLHVIQINCRSVILTGLSTDSAHDISFISTRDSKDIFECCHTALVALKSCDLKNAGCLPEEHRPYKRTYTCAFSAKQDEPVFRPGGCGKCMWVLDTLIYLTDKITIFLYIINKDTYLWREVKIIWFVIFVFGNSSLVVRKTGLHSLLVALF